MFLVLLLLVAAVVHVFAFWKRKSFPELKFSRTRKAWRKIRFNGVVEELHKCSHNRPFVGVFYFHKPILLVNDAKLAQDIIHGDLFDSDEAKLRRKLNAWFQLFQFVDGKVEEQVETTLIKFLFNVNSQEIERHKEEYGLLRDYPTWGLVTNRLFKGRLAFVVAQLFQTCDPDSCAKVFIEHHLGIHDQHKLMDLFQVAKKFLKFYSVLAKEVTHIAKHTVREVKQAPEILPRLDSDKGLLDLCIKETLRLYPLCPVVTRVTPKETTAEQLRLPDAHLMVPRGVTIAIPIARINKRAEVFENPSKFDPLRHRRSGDTLLEPTMANLVAKLVVKSRISVATK